MKKKLSVIISVICIIVSLGSISGTLYYAKNHNTFSMMQQTGGTPPAMPRGTRCGTPFSVSPRERRPSPSVACADANFAAGTAPP